MAGSDVRAWPQRHPWIGCFAAKGGISAGVKVFSSWLTISPSERRLPSAEGWQSAPLPSEARNVSWFDRTPIRIIHLYERSAGLHSEHSGRRCVLDRHKGLSGKNFPHLHQLPDRGRHLRRGLRRLSCRRRIRLQTATAEVDEVLGLNIVGLQLRAHHDTGGQGTTNAGSLKGAAGKIKLARMTQCGHGN